MANDNPRVHDVWIAPLKPSEADGSSRTSIYRFGDHLLHRVGLIEFIEVERQAHSTLRLRPEADELWALVSGECTFAWVDAREDSPTHGTTQFLDADSPTLVLAPFGVAFGVQTHSTAAFVRLATEDEQADGGGTTLPWPER